MNRRISLIAAAGMFCLAIAAGPCPSTYLPVAHAQPIYYPYESPGTIDANTRFTFSVQGVWDGDRVNAYQHWPKTAVNRAPTKNMEHAGANELFGFACGEQQEPLGRKLQLGGRRALGALTALRLAEQFAPGCRGRPLSPHLMPLTCKESMIMQIRLHKAQYKEVWDTGGAYSKGFWPPECAFAEWIIPALVAEGMEWVIVDNGHLFRTVPDFPWNDGSSCRPNPADVINPSSSALNSQWVQLQNVWAPTKVLAPWAYQPHYAQHVDPWTGTKHKIIAVPAGRYEGNENARGGYGAFKPENVWGSQVDKNTNPSKPMMILCHSDGDNYGLKNSDAWNAQHGYFLDMCKNNADFEHTSVQDYQCIRDAVSSTSNPVPGSALMWHAVL